MIPICIPTLNRGRDRLANLVETALREDNEMLPTKLVIMDNGKQFPNAINVAECEDNDDTIKQIFDTTDRIITVTTKTNLGVAASWNWFLKNVPMPEGFLIISNDDIIFDKTTLRSFYEEMQKIDTHFVIGCTGEFAIFSISEEVFKATGGFDENFYPAYFEDNDFHYRMRLVGYDFVHAPYITYGHENSSTLAAYTPEQHSAHHLNFRKNRSYYANKWGGLPTKEKYTTPFGR